MKTETIHWLQVFVLIMSTASLAGAIKAYRMGRVFPQMEWGVGAGLVNSLGLAHGATGLRAVHTVDPLDRYGRELCSIVSRVRLAQAPTDCA